MVVLLVYQLILFLGYVDGINFKNAYEKIIKIKNRPFAKPFPIMCSNEDQIRSIAILDDRAEKLIHKFMPGPITLVLKKKDNLPEYVSNGKNTIAVRMATSTFLENLIMETGCPVFMTSANRSGESTCTNLDEIEKECPDLDGMTEGNVIFGNGSTIVDCTLEKIKILREGPISEKNIKNLIN